MPLSWLRPGTGQATASRSPGQVGYVGENSRRKVYNVVPESRARDSAEDEGIVGSQIQLLTQVQGRLSFFT